ncbi:O-antigen ligase family protein [Enterococcus gilvus]|uniref:O-antigen ligase family protein n=1 Tax=Enterococcus gilvus TaxID=160453 RepID=UPI00345E4C30
MNSTKNIRNTFITLLFFLSMFFICSQQAMLFNINYLVQYIATYPWIILAIFFYFSNEMEYGKRVIVKRLSSLILAPWFFVIVITFISYLFQEASQNYLRTSVINLINILTVYLFGISAFILFGDKIIKIFISTFFSIYIAVFVKGVLLNGFEKTALTLLSIWSGGEAVGNVFEIGDITFASGILLILFLWQYFVDGKNRMLQILITLLFVLLGIKRMQIVSLLLVCVWLFLIRKKNLNFMYKLTSLIAISFMIVSLLFIYYISNGTLYRLLWDWEINTMGRVKMWEYISNYMSFTPYYFGKGYGFTLRKLSENYFEYVLHSDILRFYVELGFIPFVIWEYLNLFYIKNKIKKMFSKKEATFSFLIISYLFILHFTDNTTNYFVTQCTFFCVLSSYFYLKLEVKGAEYDDK